jgi:hypothetical protein
MGRRRRGAHCGPSHVLGRLPLMRRARCPPGKRNGRHLVGGRLAPDRSRRSDAVSRRRGAISLHQRPATPRPSPPDLSRSPLQAARALQPPSNRVSRRSHHPDPSPDFLHGRLNATVRMRRATRHPKRTRRDKRLKTTKPGVAERVSVGDWGRAISRSQLAPEGCGMWPNLSPTGARGRIGYSRHGPVQGDTLAAPTDVPLEFGPVVPAGELDPVPAGHAVQRATRDAQPLGSPLPIALGPFQREKRVSPPDPSRRGSIWASVAGLPPTGAEARAKDLRRAMWDSG